MNGITRWVMMLFLTALLATASASAQPSRFIIDDEAYVGRITNAACKLLKRGELVPLEKLRGQLQQRSHHLRNAPPAREKLAPPDLYDRMRESTLAVGAFYRCPDCDDWHFNGSTGFAVAADGIISTCCHVVMGQDEEIKEGYLIAADATGRVFPVQSVLAADRESDTCFIKIKAAGLKPLSLRANVRTGERVYCLSHPGGNHFMFTEGMVARVTRSREEVLDDNGKTNGLLTRPILFLNVTTEYAPGSSGAPVVDEAGNVVGQVVSLTDAGEPGADATDAKAPASPSVPVRFCIATEEILRLGEGAGGATNEVRRPGPVLQR
jgi:serine protease Do